MVKYSMEDKISAIKFVKNITINPDRLAELLVRANICIPTKPTCRSHNIQKDDGIFDLYPAYEEEWNQTIVSIWQNFVVHPIENGNTKLILLFK